MNISVIGSGFSSLSAAAYLAKAGNTVTIIEKNDSIGGRAREFTSQGFTFDMGPSWYWMPEVFEKFYNDHNTTTKDHYDLVRLDPSYQVIFEDERLEIPASFDELKQLFDRFEPNGAAKLERFMAASKKKYEVAMAGPIMLPGLQLTELMKPQIVSSAFHLSLTKSFSKYVNAQFKNPLIRQILQFPILFLGSTPDKIPSMYSLLNYADIKLGTWYPLGGMHQIIKGMESILKSYGVEIITGSPVKSMAVEDNRVTSIAHNNQSYNTDMVVAGADYHHVERQLLPETHQQYSSAYWEKREMAPSAIIMYLGVKGEIPELMHHNLFFDTSFNEHLGSIYTNIDWPKNPLFYISNPSKTDSSVAPAGHENLFVLIPTAPGLVKSTPGLAEHYLDVVLDRLKKKLNVDIKDRIVYKSFFMPSQFVTDYNAFKANAYGLANTLNQTHYLKPRIKHKTINNLYYTGQLTVPGPGVPPSILSGEIVANQIIKNR